MEMEVKIYFGRKIVEMYAYEELKKFNHANCIFFRNFMYFKKLHENKRLLIPISTKFLYF